LLKLKFLNVEIIKMLFFFLSADETKYKNSHTPYKNGFGDK